MKSRVCRVNLKLLVGLDNGFVPASFAVPIALKNMISHDVTKLVNMAWTWLLFLLLAFSDDQIRCFETISDAEAS